VPKKHLSTEQGNGFRWGDGSGVTRKSDSDTVRGVAQQKGEGEGCLGRVRQKKRLDIGPDLKKKMNQKETDGAG